MPKRKKSKTYESGDEQDTGDSNNEESMSESEESNQSGSPLNDVGNREEKVADEKPLDTDLTNKSPVENNLDHMSNEIVDVDETFNKEASNQDETDSELTANADSRLPKSPSDDSPVINPNYTLENGFPPGCEKIRLPPEPKSICSQVLQNKIIQVAERMRNYNYSINDDINKKKNFKNPSIYEKLIEAHGINESPNKTLCPYHKEPVFRLFHSTGTATNSSSRALKIDKCKIFYLKLKHIDDLKTHGYMFYDDLDQAQRAEWAKKDKEKKERTKIEMVSATKKK